MKIAQVANVVEAIPPRTYGGTEFVISVLTEALAQRQHDVTLFATRDSHTQATLVSVTDSLERLAPAAIISFFQDQHLIEVVQRSHSFDVIHNHILETLSFAPLLRAPLVTTLHTDLNRPTEQLLLTTPVAQKGVFVSISDSQRRALPQLPYVKTIYHGLDIASFPFNELPEDYLLFLGRITPEKGPEIAVEVAKLTNKRLIVAAKIDDPDSDYGRTMLKLFKETPQVEYIGEVNSQQKRELYRKALAFLMPIQWDEPFGLVVIEAMACGTPVIAINRGSMPEIIIDGKTGFLVANAKEMAEAVNKISRLQRADCRLEVERRFTIDRMVKEYEEVYKEVLNTRN